MTDEGFPEVEPDDAGSSFLTTSRPGRHRGPRPNPGSRPRNVENNSSRGARGGKDFQPSEGGEDAFARQPAQPVRHRPGSFPALGLCPELCAALSRKGYGFPTPIQRRVIPCVLSGRDVVAMARTGSGKTAAFLAPLLHRLSTTPCPVAASSRRNGPRALVVTPTRELALQTLRFYKAYGRELDPRVRAAVIVGGTPLEAQFESLAVCPELVVATPGRLLQILAEMGSKGGLTLSTVETLVLDEADRLFEGTLAPETQTVIDQLTPETEGLNADRQTVLVSATMPRALADFTRTCLRQNVDVLRLDADKTLSPTLAMSFVVSRSGDEKLASLVTTVRRIAADDSSRSMVVFVATHRGVEYVLEVLRRAQRNSSPLSTDSSAGVVCLHGNMDQGAREEAVAQFRKRQARVLVVTDVAARGVDLPDLDVVVNYDIAPAPKLFVHRVGRVGRAGRPGKAVNIVTADEMPYLIDTLLFLGRGVTFAKDEGVAGSGIDVDPAKEAWSQHAVAMEDNFLIGALPKSCVDDDVELLTKLRASCCELDKLRQSSINAHGLYVRTRAPASGESVRRSKQIYSDIGEVNSLIVHPWFRSMESVEERTARAHVSRLALWRPTELAVAAPEGVLKRKRQMTVEAGGGCVALKQHMENDGDSDGSNESVGKHRAQRLSEKLRAMETENAAALKRKAKKRNSRQAAMEEQRSQFYVPLRRDESDLRSEFAMKLGRDGSRGDADGLGAFRAVQSAQMDIVADTNVDMQRNGKKTMFWDRVSKKFVKGGVTSKTSRQNVHVATKEAKARARGGTNVSSYATADGSMFKAWLSKNKNAIEQVREAGQATGDHFGLSSNDFRRGAPGRGARIAALAARRNSGEVGAAAGRPKVTFRSAKPELKSEAQIKKERKMKAKAEARRMAKAKGKGRQGPSLPRPDKRSGAPSRSKQLIYKKGK